MLTFSVIQIFFSALGSVSATLYKYHYANLVAQVFMVIFNLVPVDIARLLGILTLSVGSISSLFCWFLSFVRFWRYLFFPTRQNFVFFFECIFNFFLITVQLIFFLYQAKQLSEPRKKVKYKHYLYTFAVAILFFHDFYYGALLFNVGTWYEFFGVTQFIIHALMVFLPEPDKKSNKILLLFVGIWTALLVQHIVTIIFTYTDTALSEPNENGNTLGPIIRWLASIYIVVDIVFLLNASVYFDFDPLKPYRPTIDYVIKVVDDFVNGVSNRVGGSSI